MKQIPFVRIIAILLAVWMAATISCGPKKKGKKISEGAVIFNVEFRNMESKMMPAQIRQVFKHTKTRIDFEVSHGLLRSTFISDSRDSSTIMLLDVFGTKYAARNNKEQALAELIKLPKFDLKERGDIKDIAGYECIRVTAKSKKDNLEFDVYYTDNIKAENINWHTPFGGLQGLILEYPLSYKLASHYIEMSLVAAEVKAVRVSDRMFEIPEGYKIVEQAVIEDLLDNLMSLLE